MPKIDQDEQIYDALDLVREVALTFNHETKRQGGGRSGALGPAGCDVFKALAMRRGAFARPVPFRMDELCEAACLTSRTVAVHLARLAEHGFLTISGTRSAPMALLHLPPTAIAAFERRRDEGVMPGDPKKWYRLEEALILLDRPELED